MTSRQGDSRHMKQIKIETAYGHAVLHVSRDVYVRRIEYLREGRETIASDYPGMSEIRAVCPGDGLLSTSPGELLTLWASGGVYKDPAQEALVDLIAKGPTAPRDDFRELYIAQCEDMASLKASLAALLSIIDAGEEADDEFSEIAAHKVDRAKRLLADIEERLTKDFGLLPK